MWQFHKGARGKLVATFNHDFSCFTNVAPTLGAIHTLVLFIGKVVKTNSPTSTSLPVEPNMYVSKHELEVKFPELEVPLP